MEGFPALRLCGADNFGSKAERARSERTDMLKRKNPSRMEAGMRNAAKIRPARGKRLKKAARGAVLAHFFKDVL